MTLEPRPDRLLARVCDSLERTALAQPSSREAQKQLKAGLWALRKIAGSLAERDDRLREEVDDMYALLVQHDEAAARSITNTAGDFRDRHRALQALLIELDHRTQRDRPAPGSAGDSIRRDLRALYRRMLEREGDSPSV